MEDCWYGISSAITVFRETPLVVKEGNDLLLNRFGWQAVRPLRDEVWYLIQVIDPEPRSSRLVLQRQSFGHSAEVTDANRGRADILVHLAATLGSLTGSACRTTSSIGERPDHGSVE
jgi:hypothetical protein